EEPRSISDPKEVLTLSKVALEASICLPDLPVDELGTAARQSGVQPSPGRPMERTTTPLPQEGARVAKGVICAFCAL
ncbi:MAG TPA: hypothetical protein VIS99_01970, partial [Terrimicrobiaceae bacterium]